MSRIASTFQRLAARGAKVVVNCVGILAASGRQTFEALHVVIDAQATLLARNTAIETMPRIRSTHTAGAPSSIHRQGIGAKLFAPERALKPFPQSLGFLH